MMIRQLYLAAWYYWRSISSGHQPVGTERWWPEFELAEAIAAKARAAFVA